MLDLHRFGLLDFNAVMFVEEQNNHRVGRRILVDGLTLPRLARSQ